MERIYSKIEDGLLLATIFRNNDFKDGRQDLVSDKEYLQCAALQLNKGHTFKPHKHFFKSVQESYPQESWYIVEGKVKAILYDIDDKIIAEPILNKGDCWFAHYGGHNYLVLEEGKILEYKVGPYFGQVEDKTFIY